MEGAKLDVTNVSDSKLTAASERHSFFGEESKVSGFVGDVI